MISGRRHGGAAALGIGELVDAKIADVAVENLDLLESVVVAPVLRGRGRGPLVRRSLPALRRRVVVAKADPHVQIVRDVLQIARELGGKRLAARDLRVFAFGAALFQGFFDRAQELWVQVVLAKLFHDRAHDGFTRGAVHRTVFLGGGCDLRADGKDSDHGQSARPAAYCGVHVFWSSLFFCVNA
jgi:GNAT superfamily N-acetyltransferase